jgi:hypothetical protein
MRRTYFEKIIIQFFADTKPVNNLRKENNVFNNFCYYILFFLVSIIEYFLTLLFSHYKVYTKSRDYEYKKETIDLITIFNKNSINEIEEQPDGVYIFSLYFSFIEMIIKPTLFQKPYIDYFVVRKIKDNFKMMPVRIQNKALFANNIHQKKQLVPTLIKLAIENVEFKKSLNLPELMSLIQSNNDQYTGNYFQRVYFVPLTTRLFKRKLSKKVWSVGLKYVSSIEDLYSSDTILIQNNLNSFFADPFILFDNESHFIFVEEFIYDKDKGVISLIEIRNGESIYLGIIIEEDYHISFPFIYSYKDTKYLVCQSSNNGLLIYKCESFPMLWVKDEIILKKELVTDPILIPMNDKFLLIYNKEISEINDFNHISESIFYFPESKRVHRINVLSIIDSSKSRNAGFLTVDGKDYIVKQKHGNDIYGESMQLFEFSPYLDFSLELPKFYITAADLNVYSKQVHTLSYSNGVFAFDFTIDKPI